MDEIAITRLRIGINFRNMNISINGKYALICGSSQGIGLACARVLASLGANCILMARNELSLKLAISQLPQDQGQEHHYAVADFSDPNQVRDAVYEIVQQFKVEILVNNTGGPQAGPITDAPEEAFEQAFQQHLICNHILAKAVLLGMQQSGYGRIINIISTSVKTPLANLGVSNTIRAAVASWAKTLANEVGKYNITVNNVLPGLTDTLRLQNLIEHTAAGQNTDAETVREQMLASIPMKRIGKAEEIANVVGFLASPAASYVNGVNIPVDGGRTPAL